MPNIHNQATLYYIHDPMCSWCWGFRPVWQQLKQQLIKEFSGQLEIKYLLGGLATDSQESMNDELQTYLQQTWRKIQQTIPGTEFNFDFWQQSQPRRSTYPACRAVIATKMQNLDLEDEMILKIQQAYYLHAQNPSDNNTLIELAKELGLDTDRFSQDLNSQQAQQQLDKEINFGRQIKMRIFPSLALQIDEVIYPIQLDYNDVNTMFNQIKKAL